MVREEFKFTAKNSIDLISICNIKVKFHLTMNYSNSPNNMYFLSLVINNFIAKLLNFIHE